jgi:nitroreductase
METKNKKDDLLKIYAREWFVQAPLVFAACADPSKAWQRKDGKNYAEVDTTIAMDHFILAATDLGLGTCWIAAFDPETTREIFKLTANLEPIALTPLGYPADEPKVKKRKELNEIVIYL